MRQEILLGIVFFVLLLGYFTGEQNYVYVATFIGAVAIINEPRETKQKRSKQ